MRTGRTAGVSAWLLQSVPVHASMIERSRVDERKLADIGSVDSGGFLIGGWNIEHEAMVGVLQLFCGLVDQAETRVRLSGDIPERDLETERVFCGADSVPPGFSGLIVRAQAPAAAISGSTC